MNDKVKEILDRNNYKVTVEHNSRTHKIYLKLPKRNQHPAGDECTIIYSFVDNLLYITIDGETVEVECPTYLCRLLIYVDIRKICHFYNFDTSLLEFFSDQVKITESEFFKAMWPSDMTLTEDIAKKEKDIYDIVSKAINAPIPFHESFRFAAHYLNVEHGYDLVASYYFGDTNE